MNQTYGFKFLLVLVQAIGWLTFHCVYLPIPGVSVCTGVHDGLAWASYKSHGKHLSSRRAGWPGTGHPGTGLSRDFSWSSTHLWLPWDTCGYVSKKASFQMYGLLKCCVSGLVGVKLSWMSGWKNDLLQELFLLMSLCFDSFICSFVCHSCQRRSNHQVMDLAGKYCGIVHFAFVSS